MEKPVPTHEAHDAVTGTWRPCVIVCVASYVGKSGPGYDILWTDWVRPERGMPIPSSGGWVPIAHIREIKKEDKR